MCYGDIDHGSDRYYEEWAKDQQEQAEQERVDNEDWEIDPETGSH
jgi:hypothetical protein